MTPQVMGTLPAKGGMNQTKYILLNKRIFIEDKLEDLVMQDQRGKKKWERASMQKLRPSRERASKVPWNR